MLRFNKILHSLVKVNLLRAITLVTFLLSITPVFAQNTSYQLTIYNSENGFSSNVVKSIFKDKTGFIWLLSESGLTRFDGYTFKKFKHDLSDSSSISSVDMKMVAMNKSGTLLFLTSNSISKYIPSSNSFVPIISYTKSDEITLLLSDGTYFWTCTKSEIIRIDAENSVLLKFSKNFPNTNFNLDNDRIWIRDKLDLFYLDITSEKLVKVAINTGNTSLSKEYTYPFIFFRDSKNNSCLLASQQLYKLDATNNAFNCYAHLDAPTELISNFDGAVYYQSSIYVSLHYSSLLKIDCESGKSSLIKLPPSGEKDKIVEINALKIGKSNSILVSTSTSGMFSINPVTLQVSPIIFTEAKRNFKDLSNITCFLEDEHVVWFSSPGLGLVKGEELNPLFASYQPINTITDRLYELAKNTRSIASYDSTHLLLSTLNGLIKFDLISHAFEPLAYDDISKKAFGSNPYSKILVDTKKNTWIASWNKPLIYILDAQHKRYVRINPFEAKGITTYQSLRSLFLDSKGNLWLGTDGNLLYRAAIADFDFSKPELLEFKKIVPLTKDQQTVIFNTCFSIAEDKDGDLLFATQQGFFTYSYISKSFTQYTGNAKSTNSISENDVRSIWVDRDNIIWLGTNGGGLNRFDKQKKEFKVFTTNNGLPDNTIYSVLEDEHENLWMGTNNGLCRFNKLDESCRNFSLKDGVENYEFNTCSAFKLPSGKLVFGGIVGFTMFHPDSIQFTHTSPTVVITQFNVKDKAQLISSDELILNYDNNYVSFEFAALNYFRNNENIYAYKLDGVDKDWVYCGNRRFTNYASLAPGNYTFRVKSSNSYGIWSTHQAEVKFKILSPWYTSWWFYVLVFCSVFSIIYLLYHYRLQQAIELESVRNSIARDLHDEIGSNLSSISLFTEVAKEKSATSESGVSGILQKISDYTQTSQEAMNDIVWMINTRNDRFENIIVRMRSLAVELLEAKNIHLHLSFDERLNQLKMGMNERKNFYLLYKEILNNCVKYAEANQVWIELSITSNVILLSIKDDGIGFDPAVQLNGNGLINMKKRAEVLGATLTINSSKGTGTHTKLTFQT